MRTGPARAIKSRPETKSVSRQAAGSRYDVVVAGGGLAGAFAAIAAAREGARVALFEQYGFLGGMATAAPVTLFMQYHVLKGAGISELVKGLFEETVNRLRQRGMMLETPFSFDDIAMRRVLDELVSEAGVHVRFHTFLFGATVRAGRVQSVRLADKSGERRVTADLFVDCTGDGDLAHFAGAEFRYGRADGKAQPMTPVFLVAGVDRSRLPDRKTVRELIREAHAAGRTTMPNLGSGFWVTPHPDMLLFNASHVWNRSGIDPEDLSLAEIEGRKQTEAIMTDFRRNVPGFENAYIARAGVQIGVRETRHLVGRYTLTEGDVLGGRKFEDGIARCAFEIDIHSIEAGKPGRNDVVPPGVYYEVPYRCLLPAKGPRNVLVACRALSATHEANASLRIMPTMSAVGEAAGIAAARALSCQADAGRVDAATLKQDLIRLKIMGDPDRP